MQGKCDRCGHQQLTIAYTFYELKPHNRKQCFGVFCSQCTTELVDELRGKLEWFQTDRGWKGYINPKARSELKKTGFLHTEDESQSIEIVQIGQKGRESKRRDRLEVLRVRYAGGLISKEEYLKLMKVMNNENPHPVVFEVE